MFTALILMLIFSLPGVITAQPDTSRQMMRQELDKIMKDGLIEKVGLSETTADMFMSNLDEERRNIRELMDERKDLMQDIDFDPGAADIEQKLDRVFDIDIQIAGMKKEFKNRLRQFMSAQEIAKTMKFRRKFEKELRKEIGKRKGRDGKDRPGPNGPPDFDMPPPPFER